MKKQKRNILNQRGFTLIEIMVVVTIISLIFGLLIKNLWQSLDEANVSTTKITIQNLSTALLDYKRVCGSYPTTDQGLDALVRAPQVGKPCKNYMPGGFIKRVPQDAWKNDFIFTSDGAKFTIISYGADGQPGGEGINADISSDDLD